MSDNRRSVTINNSTSKHQFAFSKSSRFSVAKPNTNAIHYELVGQFGHQHGKGAGKGFSSSQTRFATYKANCNTIHGPGNRDRQGNDFGQTMRYSFGVSRDQMKKTYVDEIHKQGRDSPSPGPDRYTAEPGFGTAKSGSRYSMRPKNDLFTLHLEKSKKLPGPGSYHDSVNLAGKAQLCSKLNNQP